MFKIFYDLGLILLTVLLLPKFFYGILFKKKYRESTAKRFGWGFPRFDRDNKFCIWIHAVSVGEAKAVSPLAKMIKQAHPDAILIISTVTETGHAESLRSLPFADHHVYLPFDYAWVIKPIMKRVKPNLLILCETDFWYNFLYYAKKEGAKIVLVNGKMSLRSQQRFEGMTFLSKRIFDLVDQFYLQGQSFASHFLSLGVPKEKIRITGNMKLDVVMSVMNAKEKEEWQQKLGIQSNDQVIVIGSSHDPEEKLLLEALKNVWDQIPALKVILVPRHPERYHEIATLLTHEGYIFDRFSQGVKNSGKAKLMLVDAMGVLKNCYQFADVALVAGSWTDKIGGHNIIEPSWYGKPVIYGPHMFTQPDFVTLMQEYQAGIQIGVEGLPAVLLDILKHPDKGTAMGARGLKLCEESRGATAKTFNLMREEKFI